MDTYVECDELLVYVGDVDLHGRLLAVGQASMVIDVLAECLQFSLDALLEQMVSNAGGTAGSCDGRGCGDQRCLLFFHCRVTLLEGVLDREQVPFRCCL